MDFIETVANIEKSGKAIKNKIKMKRFHIKFEFLLKKKERKKETACPRGLHILTAAGGWS